MSYTSEGYQHWMDPSPNDTAPKPAPALWSWTWQSQESVTQLPGCASSSRDIPGKLWLLHWAHEPPQGAGTPILTMVARGPRESCQQCMVCSSEGCPGWQSSAEGSGEHTASVFKWDSLIRLQLLHFTRRKLFIDTASFIYFLNAHISLVWSCREM